MKLILILSMLVFAGCSTPRVLVKDCYRAGPEVQDCALIHELE